MKRSFLMIVFATGLSVMVATTSFASPADNRAPVDVEISAMDCVRFLTSTPFGGPSFIKGYDARGRAVAPAGADQLKAAEADFFIISISPDPVLPKLSGKDALAPSVTFERARQSLVHDGRLLNGKSSSQIASGCRAHLAR